MSNSHTKKHIGRCPECGSGLTVSDGAIVCTQDMLPEYEKEFKEWQNLSEEALHKKVAGLSFKIYDMYGRWKFKDEMGNRTQYCCTYNPSIEFNPMTQSETILPDPVQQKIAERILKRKLTEKEYYGLQKVPLLNEDGEVFWGQIQQLVYPKDYTSKITINYTDGEMVPKFNWEDI